jgi:hypothetical protein
MLFILLATVHCDTDKECNHIPGPQNGYLFLFGSKYQIMGSEIITIPVPLLLTGFSRHVRKCIEQRYHEGL